MTFAQRVIAAQHLLVAPCSRCRSLCSADPSLRIATVCMGCHAVLMPRREVAGISFREPRGVA